MPNVIHLISINGLAAFFRDKHSAYIWKTKGWGSKHEKANAVGA
jgi:hypothetical protein